MAILRITLTFQIVLCFVCFARHVPAEDATAGKKPKPQSESNPKSPPVDARVIVAALANRNSAPKLVGKGRVIPVFDDKYEWSENDRIWKTAIPDLTTHIEEAWPEMWKNVDDKRYCITLGDDIGPHNWSVGGVCYTLIRLTLEDPLAAANPTSKSEAVKLKPDLIRDPEKLKQWCLARSSKKLYELQIEVCELSIAKNAKYPKWVTALKAEISLLRESKRATLPFGFGDYEVYSRERAKEFLEELKKKRPEKGHQ